ncbi:MAG: hypothetical protein LQ349_004076 [Xanthoria aureola]|nr:MAG: hypothetical protein LQ349_004076 [Xanthoria aureola]
MPERHEYALAEFTTTAGSRPISSRSRRSSDPSPQNPFVDQTDHLANPQPSQPYDAASNNLLAAENEQHHAHGDAFLPEWKWELTAWLVAAISLVSLIILFAVYSDKPLREWGTDITPATTVAILSQVGQTAILAPVTACISRKTVLQASKLGQTLWIGASDTQDYTSPGLNTLIQFYVIYVPDFIIWDSLDPTEDHKEELVALQATLSLCLNKCHTDMTFGVTDTNLVSKETDLGWQTGSETFEQVSFDTVTVTHDAEKFWMSGLNQSSFNKYLSLQTFTGSASMRSEEPDGGGNFTENDVVRVIAASLYDDRAGMPGLTKLLDNLAVSMSNALRTTTDVPDNIRGTPSSFEVYIQIEWAWLIVPVAAVGLSLVFLLLTIYLSRKRKIPAWKSSLLAVLLGLTSETRRDWGAIRRPREMEETAKGRSIRLEANGGQWQMVKAD